MLEITTGKLRTAAAIGVLVAAAACGDDSPVPSGSVATGGELWVLQTRVYAGDDTMTGYAIPVDELAGDIGNEHGIEQFGGGWVFAKPGKPDSSFLLTHGERAAAIRYKMSRDNQFLEGKTVSFEGYGVQSGYGIVAWVDSHTAYWFDSVQLQAIRFDPTTMEITNVFAIEGVMRDGLRAWFSDHPVVRDDGVFITMNWSSSWEDGEEPDSPSGATLVHIDPATDEVTVTTDDRCTSLLASMTTPDGDAHFFSSYENAYVRIATAGERGVPDCALRLRKGESTFDPDWSLDLTELTGGRPADGVLPGENHTMWLRVFHSEKVDAQPREYDAIDSAAAWQWYKLTFDRDAQAQKNTERPYSPHGFGALLTQGRSFYMEANEDYSASELLELKDDTFVRRATVVGELNTLIRVR